MAALYLSNIMDGDLDIFWQRRLVGVETVKDWWEKVVYAMAEVQRLGKFFGSKHICMG